MKRTFVIVVAIGLALLAAALAPVFKKDPGLVQVHFLGWTIETSVLILALAAVFVWLVVHFLIRLWRMPAETARRVRDRRALAQLEKGLLALTEGDWSTAERALQKSASTHGRTTARYLAAAQAADGQDAGDRAEWYLEQADSSGSKKRFLVELTRARILCANGHYGQALPILEELHRRRRKHPQVLELLSACYREEGHWDELHGLLPRLQKAGLLSDERVAEMKSQSAISKLTGSSDLDDLKSQWKSLPRQLQREPEVVAAYARQAIDLGGPEMTEQVLRVSLNRDWNPALLSPYGDPGAGDTSKRLKQCEKWLRDHPEDARLHLVIGRLCAVEKIWGKAREHMVRSLEIEPTVAGYDSLGQLLERRGELEVAMACFRNALRVSQGEEPLPLPQGQERLTPPDSAAEQIES